MEKFPKQRFYRYDFERNFRKKELYNKNGPLITSAKPKIKNKSESTKIALVTSEIANCLKHPLFLKLVNCAHKPK